MSIIPVGNRKDQKNQGALKNQSILDSVLFKKIGQGADALVPNKAKPDPVRQMSPQAPPSNIDNVMSSVGLDHGGMADQLEQRTDPAIDQDPQSAQGIAPAGAPADRFLGRNEDEDGQQADPNQIWNEERAKIRQYVKNRYKFKLKQNPDGTMTVQLTPGGNRPVLDPGGFVDGLIQYLGGASVNEEETPSEEDVGQPIMVSYRPNSAGPQKIHKGKNRR